MGIVQVSASVDLLSLRRGECKSPMLISSICSRQLTIVLEGKIGFSTIRTGLFIIVLRPRPFIRCCTLLELMGGNLFHPS